MKLTVVGCSPAWPNPGGAQSGYLLEGPGTWSKLGYDPDDAPVITDPWLKLFPEGVALSTSAALCPPAVPGEDPATPDTCRRAPPS